jgi:D-alanine-D-alanine ligase
MKTRVAVFFGGRSPEHDVSIVTGLQAMEALDQQIYESFPVYIAANGEWWVGEPLRDRANYIPSEQTLKSLDSVTLDVGANPDGLGRLITKQGGGLLGKRKTVEFDVALLAFHGLAGEDGRLQGLFDVANVPYTGMRTMASAVFMDKAATKRLLAKSDIPLLPDAIIDRPVSGLIPAKESLEAAIAGLEFPFIVKPLHLGSSIGVARATNIEVLRASLGSIFRLDTQAIVEPFVENLVEYNVAVARFGGEVTTSAIERPKRVEELLDFRTKYMSEDGKSGSKTPGQSSQGMLSLTRDINPDIPPEMDANIRDWAAKCFQAAGGTGAPRIDFLSNAETGEVWLNEVNPCPGSLGFFLWEAAKKPLFFPDFLGKLIEEARAIHRSQQLPDDPTNPEARLFRRN